MNHCVNCGAQTEDGVMLSSGELVPACDGCSEPFIADFRRMQSDAKALLDQGVHPKMMNRIMCARVNGDWYG